MNVAYRVERPARAPHVDGTLFRQALAAVASPVTVVTTMTEGGTPAGTTVSAFMSLSLEPPMVVISLDRASTLLGHLSPGTHVGINVLAAHQDGAALCFARKVEDKFDGVAWHLDAGLPRLDGSAAWLACEIDSLIDGGDHIIATAFVAHADVADAAPPLVYYRRTFGTHHPSPTPA